MHPNQIFKPPQLTSLDVGNHQLCSELPLHVGSSSLRFISFRLETFIASLRLQPTLTQVHGGHTIQDRQNKIFMGAQVPDAAAIERHCPCIK